MTTKDKEAREFWIDLGVVQNDGAIRDELYKTNYYNCYGVHDYHVIEYSAYEQKKKEADKLKAKVKKLEKANAVLYDALRLYSNSVWKSKNTQALYALAKAQEIMNEGNEG